MGKGKNSALKRRRIRAFYALASVAAAVIILLLCMTVFFNVTNVQVEGVTVYRKEQVINVGGILQNMNLVRTDTGKAKQRLLDNLVYIDDVEIKKSYPSTVIITCTEAVKAADIEFEGEYYVLSSSGKILESGNKQPTGGIPVVKGFTFYQGDDIARREDRELTETEKRELRRPGTKLKSADTYSDKIVTDLVNEIAELGLKDVKTIDVTSRADIVINVDDRIEIKLGSAADSEYKLGYFKAVVDRLAEDYEGELIYNGSDNGVSAIPKDKVQDLKKLGDSSASDSSGASDSSSADPNAQQAWADDGTGAYYGDQQWTDNGYYGDTWNDPGWNNYDWTDNGGWDTGYTDTWTDGGYTEDNGYGW